MLEFTKNAIVQDNGRKAVDVIKKCITIFPRTKRGEIMRHKTVIIATIFSLFLFISEDIFGQRKLDKFITSISNDDLQFNVSKVGTTSITDSNIISLPQYLVFVKSVNVDDLLLKVKRKKVIKTLVSILNDSTKDWYANVLLYQITARDATLLVLIANRDDWVRRNRENDILYWQRLLERYAKTRNRK